MKKQLKVLVVASFFTIISTFVSLAGWEQTGTQWKYKDDVSSAYLTGWQWIDGNGDNIAECYYLNADGVMASNTVIDSYSVNESGAWIVNSVVQTKVVSTNTNTPQNNTNVNNKNQNNTHKELNSTDDWGEGMDFSKALTPDEQAALAEAIRNAH